MSEAVLELIRKRKILAFKSPCFSSKQCSKCDGYPCLFIRRVQNYYKNKVCNSCGKHAIMFNPFNDTINCHACGAMLEGKIKVMLW